MKRLLVTLAALIAVACAPNTASAPTVDDNVRVVIRNLSFQDVIVFEVSEGHRRRIARVTAQTTESKGVPVGVDQNVQFMISLGMAPSAKRTYLPAELVTPGNVVELSVHTHLPNSFVFVRR